MDQAALLRFLMDASRRGYAAGRSAVKMREADHSTTIVLEHGDWKFHDNYFGGEPYGGREVVFLGGQPVWMAVLDVVLLRSRFTFAPAARADSDRAVTLQRRWPVE
jgi:hypothetical protein